MFYNVNTANSVVKIFNLCFFIGNTCIYSFLSVFLRHLGLSAFQVGLLRGLQALTALLCIPLVIFCGRKCLHRRPPMMSCLFLTMAAYLSLLVISLPAPSCFHKKYPVCENYTTHWTMNETGTLQVLQKHVSERSSSLTTEEDKNPTLVTEPVVRIRSSTAHSNVVTLQNESDIVHEPQNIVRTSDSTLAVNKILFLPTSEKYMFFNEINTYEHNLKTNKPKHNVEIRRAYLARQSSNSYETNGKYLEGNWMLQLKKRSNVAENAKSFQNISGNKKNQETWVFWPGVDISCFIILLLILLIGEVSASPVETIANDAWFTYLDEIDYLVAFSKKSISIPALAALAVFATGCVTIFYCGFGPALNAYSLHIYLFGIFFGLALVVTAFYPFPQEQKSFYRNLASLGRCLQGRESYLLFTTATVSGILQAAFTEFTLWFIEDIGGSEFTASTAVAVALLSMAVTLVFSKKIHGLTSRNAMVAFGIFCCATQFLIYVAIQIPWVIVSSQVLQFGSTYTFWTSLRYRLQKVLKLKSDHSFALALKGFHLLGYALGAVLDGALYTHSPTLLFSAMALLSLIWCLVLFFCEFCCLHQPFLSPAHQTEEEIKLFDDMQHDSEDD